MLRRMVLMLGLGAWLWAGISVGTAATSPAAKAAEGSGSAIHDGDRGVVLGDGINRFTSANIPIDASGRTEVVNERGTRYVADAPAVESPRAARSVHLGYTAPEAAAFYNELTVEKSTPGSYFMACGFHHGYFGIQEQAKGRKVVIFSVWDPTRGDNPTLVPNTERVEVLDKAEDVRVQRFGGEGTGGQSFYEYAWKPGETYRFFIRASADAEKTSYAAYFFVPESKNWKRLVTFRTTTGGARLAGLYSFIEDFRRDGKSANEERRARFGNGWVCDVNGQWTALSKARFTASGASWEAKGSIDAGAVQDVFYLQTGGQTRAHVPLNSSLRLPTAPRTRPQVPE